MKKVRLFILGLVAFCCQQVSAYDFSAVAQHYLQDQLYEVELYYTINADGTTVTVTKGPDVYNAIWVNIPETVEYDGKTYTVTTIGYQAFDSGKISKVIMPNTITEIQSSAFNRSSVDSVSFSKGLKSIGDNAFNEASSLTSVVLYEGLEKIGDYAFSTGGYYSSPGLHRVILPNSLTDIGERAFQYQLNLNYVKLPENLKELKENTFHYCPSLKEITLPETLEIIGESAFGATALNTINFPSSLKEIGASAFSGCGFTEIVLPDNVETLGESAFASNTALTSITFSKGMKVLPKSVCSYCSQLVNVTIPEGITTVEWGVFDHCERLSYVAFPESVTDMSAGYFFLNSGITRVTLPSTLTELPAGIFQYCYYLTEFTIPDHIQSIGKSAFRDCTNLTKVVIPESVTTIGADAFDGCKILTEVNLPSQLTAISANMFYDCESLETIVIPTTVESIGQSAFSNCISLKEITIPHAVASIGQYALSGCTNLTEVHAQRAILPRVTGLANSPVIIHPDNTCTLYVPRGAKATYEASSCWSNFMAIEEEDVPDVYYQFGASVVKGRGKVTIDEQNIVSNKVDTLLNSTVTVTFVPNDGYTIDYVTCNGEDITGELNAELQWTVASVETNYVLEVAYKELPVTLHLTSGQGGSITLKVEKGERFTCNFQAEEGWTVNAVSFNGRDVTAEWSEEDGYTTPQLTAESTLSVSFEQINEVRSISASNVKAYAQSSGVMVIEGLSAGETVQIFSADGLLVSTLSASGARQTVTLDADALYIVKTATKTIKVRL